LGRGSHKNMETEIQDLNAQRGESLHDFWFRAKVQEALNDSRPDIPHEQVEALFSVRRAVARRKSEPKRLKCDDR
jgi:phage shock protein A